jgi:hypothetical protein
VVAAGDASHEIIQQNDDDDICLWGNAVLKYSLKRRILNINQMINPV